MARDIKMIWNNNFLEGDLKLNKGDLEREEGLETAVFISLFTDRRADDEDEIDNVNDKRGWWADNTMENKIGSKLWQYERIKTTTNDMIKVKAAIEESLQWLIDDEVAKEILVTTERFGSIGNDRIAVSIVIKKSKGNEVAIKFDDLWKIQLGG
jgi:phage gp46-like protein